MLKTFGHQTVTASRLAAQSRVHEATIATSKDGNGLLIAPLEFVFGKVPRICAISLYAFTFVLIHRPLFKHVRIWQHQHILVLMIVPEYLRVQQINSHIVVIFNRT